MKKLTYVSLPVRQTQILLLIKQNPEILSPEIAAKLKITSSNVRNILSDLSARGLIARKPARWELSEGLQWEKTDASALKNTPAGKRGRPANK